MPAEASARIAYLDGLRAVAIVAVLGVHWGERFVGIGSGGYIGVDIFFVLSGYIITKITWRRRDTFSYKNFLVKRARRLYPALLGVVIVAVPAAMFVGVLSSAQGALGGALSLFQANTFVAGLQLASPDPFGITWSLSAEWVFYFVWPVLLLLLRFLPARNASLYLAGGAVALYALSLFTSPEWFYYGPTSRGAQMLAGSAIALGAGVWRPSARAGRLFRVVIPLALVFIGAYVFGGPPPLDAAYRVAGFPLATAFAAVLILSGTVLPAHFAVRALSNPWVSGLGKRSYSLYLWHTIPLLVFAPLSGKVAPILLACLVAILTAVFTWLSYRYLEAPFLKSRGIPVAVSTVATSN